MNSLNCLKLSPVSFITACSFAVCPVSSGVEGDYVKIESISWKKPFQ